MQDNTEIFAFALFSHGHSRDDYFAENLNTVFESYVSPGFRIVDGKLG
jgi:hypothetical protein